jgi:hypothetical protein
MIDSDIIESLDRDTKDNVKVALVTLKASGVISLMEERILERLVAGHEFEDDEELVRRIKLYRRDLSQLRELKSLCETYEQDNRQ